MPSSPYEPAINRLGMLLVQAHRVGELNKNKRSYSPRHLARILGRVAKEGEPSTSWNTIGRWLSQPSVIIEINQTLIRLRSPLRVKPTKTLPPGKNYIMIYGCVYGPFGVLRRPLRPRILHWLSNRPKFVDWWLSRPSIL